MGINELTEALTEIYEREESWHTERLSHNEALKYHQAILLNQHVITICNGQELAGYCEFYINNGVCFVANLFIRPEYRQGKTIKMLKNKLFEVSKGAKIFIGERNKFQKKYMETQLRRNHGK